MADNDTIERVDDARVMRLWRKAGLPEYFLGNGGTNVHLCEFARLCAADTIESLMADALRYRWIRMHPTFMGWDSDYRPDEIDTQVDAALADGERAK